MRSLFKAAMLAIVGVLVSVGGWAQQSAPSVDQLLDKYVEAVGGTEKYAGISTWYEKREITGDLTDHVPRGRAPTPVKSHGVWEYSFKAPNLRITSVRSDRNDYIEEWGCDGKVSWWYSPKQGMQKRKPRASDEGECRPGMGPFPTMLRREKAKLELKGQKEVAGRMTFLIRAEVPAQPGWTIYYLDSETSLLLRTDSRRGESRTTMLFSDYRDVAGVKVPFQVEWHGENTDRVTRLLDLQIDSPIDDQVFLRPNW